MLWIVALTVSCERVTDPQEEGISGRYVVTQFTEPGQHDGGMDIPAKSGMVTTRLSSNLEVEEHLVIPEDSGPSFPPVDVPIRSDMI